MIPKIIHYCWFGRNEKPELIKKCIESWKTYCPDYEIIEWNEDNFDVDFCEFSKTAYELKKWAFVSDLARLVVVYENGGIYLDTDVELKSNIDNLLKYDAWFAQENKLYINSGMGFGASKNNRILKELITVRKRGKYSETACPAIETPIIKQCLDLTLKNESQILNNVAILSSTEYSNFAKHLGTKTWLSEKERDLLKNRNINKHVTLKKLLRNPKIIKAISKNSDNIFAKFYIFLSYDLLDNGLKYFIARKRNK